MREASGNASEGVDVRGVPSLSVCANRRVEGQAVKDLNAMLAAEAEPTPDPLNRLHTLRSLANAVKQQLDAMKLYSISWRVAAISEQATEAIEHLNAVTPTKDEQQDSRGPG